MRTLVALALTAITLAGCGDHDRGAPAPDMSAPTCPGNVDVNPPGVACSDVGATCLDVNGLTCRCLCTGRWECDQVQVICDPDLGPSD